MEPTREKCDESQGGGLLTYKGYIGTCGPKEYGF